MSGNIDWWWLAGGAEAELMQRLRIMVSTELPFQPNASFEPWQVQITQTWLLEEDAESASSSGYYMWFNLGPHSYYFGNSGQPLRSTALLATIIAKSSTARRTRRVEIAGWSFGSRSGPNSRIYCGVVSEAGDPRGILLFHLLEDDKVKLAAYLRPLLQAEYAYNSGSLVNADLSEAIHAAITKNRI